VVRFLDSITSISGKYAARVFSLKFQNMPLRKIISLLQFGQFAMLQKTTKVPNKNSEMGNPGKT